MSDTKSVHEAWADVMADVTALGKDQRNQQQGFNFRGVDDVMNAVGPILRKHRVAVIPSGVTTSHRDVQTSNGKPQREATVVVTYTIVGPDGSTMSAASAGESSDSGDKATPKAMSVAYRTVLLQALCLPTNEADPDHHVMERGAAGPSQAQVDAQATADGLPKCESLERLRHVQTWAEQRNLMAETVTDETSAQHTLAELFAVYAERLGAVA